MLTKVNHGGLSTLRIGQNLVYVLRADDQRIEANVVVIEKPGKEGVLVRIVDIIYQGSAVTTTPVSGVETFAGYESLYKWVEVHKDEGEDTRVACLFLENVPNNVVWDSSTIKAYLIRLKHILNGRTLEIHDRNVSYSLLTEDGAVEGTNHGVHGFIYWHEGASITVMGEVGNAIQALLDFHNIGEGFDLTFIEGGRGQSFYYNRRMVP